MNALEKFLAVVSRHKLLGWTGLLMYAMAVIFPHDLVQYYVNEIAIHYTHKRLYQGAATGGVVLAVLVSLIFLWGLRRQPQWLSIGVCWLITLTLIIATWWTFMANNTELVHFPQYFPEGLILLALTRAPVDSIAWGTIFGGFDECFQYWFIVQGKPVPYDFNDIFMDLLGTAAGVVFAMTFMRTERPGFVSGWWKGVMKRPGILAICAIVATGIVLWATGIMVVYEAAGAAPHLFSLSRQTHLPFWFSISFLGPRTFHELSPVEGPILILMALGLYSLMDRYFQISAPNLQGGAAGGADSVHAISKR